jgi:hypothetical protein
VPYSQRNLPSSGPTKTIGLSKRRRGRVSGLEFSTRSETYTMEQFDVIVIVQGLSDDQLFGVDVYSVQRRPSSLSNSRSVSAVMVGEFGFGVRFGRVQRDHQAFAIRALYDHRLLSARFTSSLSRARRAPRR